MPDFIKNNGLWIAAGVLLLLSGAWLYRYGLVNRQDPMWAEVDELLRTEFFSVSQAGDSLYDYYKTIHPTSDRDRAAVIDLVATPFMPTMEWGKMKRYLDHTLQSKFVLFSSVPGSGTTTLTSRLAKLIASDPEANVLEILCAPQFDLEYNRQYIGHTDNGKFVKGELLYFFDRCRAHPEQRFVALIDNFDKINPETFFGPHLWAKLDDESYRVVYGGEDISIPANFYLIAVTHTGVTSKVEFNDEHFKRLGGQQLLQPSVEELIMYLQGEKQKYAARQGDTDPVRANDAKASLAALEDTTQLRNFVYFFIKINHLLQTRYSPSYTLGQWSNYRKLYLPGNEDACRQLFINHINALRPEDPLRKEDLADIDYSIQHNGELRGTHLLGKAISFADEKGFLTEFIVGLSFILVTGIGSLYFFKMRQYYVKHYLKEVHQLVEQYDKGQIDHQTVGMRLNTVRKEVDELVVKNKITYTEAIFFYNFIQDNTRRIELARQVHEGFLSLLDNFLEDQVLTTNEYSKLQQFLEGIKSKISEADYKRYRQEIDNLYYQFKR